VRAEASVFRLRVALAMKAPMISERESAPTALTATRTSAVFQPDQTPMSST
jgi:hypothetical protein